MKFISPGKWFEEALQISMTREELSSWIRGYDTRGQKPPIEIAVKEAGKKRAHFYVVEQSRIIIYEEETD